MPLQTRVSESFCFGENRTETRTRFCSKGVLDRMGSKPIRPSVERAKMAEHEAKNGGTARGEYDAPTDALLQPFVTREDMRMPRDQSKAKKSSSSKPSGGKRPSNHGEF